MLVGVCSVLSGSTFLIDHCKKRVNPITFGEEIRSNKF